MTNWITTKAAANILEISRQWIRKLAKKGIIESKKEGRRLKVNLTPDILERYSKNKIQLPEDFNEAQKRYVLIRLKAIEMLKKGINLVEVAKSIGVCHKTVYNWINSGLIEKYENKRIRGLLNKESTYRGKFRSLNDEQIKMIQNYKTKHAKASEAALYRMIQSDFKASGWDLPHLRTVRKVFDEIPEPQMTLEKEGSFAYDSKVVHRRKRPEEKHPNDYFESDEIVADAFVINKKGEIFRPRLIIIIDSHTRGIPGFALGKIADSRLLDEAFKNSVMNEQCKPFCGFPKLIAVDNGKIFVSAHISRIWAEMGVEYRPLKVKAPYLKGKVERVSRTLQEGCLSFLKAYTGNNPKNRPEKIIPIPIEDLEEKIIDWIEKYHRTIHSAIKMTPIEKFQAAIKRGWQPEGIKNKELLDLIFLYRAKRIIGKEGIKAFGKCYFNKKLYDLFGRKVEIRYDKNNLNEIKVFYKDKFFCSAQIEDTLSAQLTIDTIKEEQKEAREIKKAYKKINEQAKKEADEFAERAARFKAENTFQDIDSEEMIEKFTKERRNLKLIKSEEKEEEFKEFEEKPKKRKYAIYPHQLDEVNKDGV